MSDARNSFATATDVAQLAGVSRSAVSRTFTDGASVSPKTRAKVLEAAEALGYHVNLLARGLSKVASRPVCLISSSFETPFYAALLSALSTQIQSTGRSVMIITTSGPTDTVETALTRAMEYRAGTIVVMSGSPPEPLVQACIATGQQVILINRKGKDTTQPGPVHVTIDYARASQQAVAMLAEAGCRSVAVIGSDAGTPSLIARENGFRDIGREQGLDVTMIRAGPTGYQTGVDAAHIALSSPDRPDGVFCVTDHIACGFMDAARQAFGLRIPDDISVLGFDDIEQAGWGSYQMTTFRQPLGDIAAHVCDIINSQPPKAGVTIFLEAIPVWRDSVKRMADFQA
ncbi:MULTISPECIES: substrate-binding domain-containing protein [unclassified Yoonia]|uniref:LacI family DNA-binding transcriptional regulator n=1 Tax=unclassified Yoonia TaxID=2629118 RepID=UPI002AFF51A4|nr:MULTISPECIES: substrate-binding domain-containing protein [unclassified Yoonia]